MHMKNPAQTRSGCIRFSDWKIENATFAEYVCPIRLRGARYLYLNVVVEKRNISGVYRYNWVSERIQKLLKIDAQALVSLKKYMPPSSSLLQGKHLPFTPSTLRLNIFRLFVILSLTQLYRYTPEIFLFSTATFKYK
jgi:hypothetical protein